MTDQQNDRATPRRRSLRRSRLRPLWLGPAWAALVAGLVLGAAAPAGAAESRPIAGSRDLLERLGVDQSQFELFVDQQPLSGSEREVTERVMYFLRRFDQADLERWARPDFDPEAIRESAAAERGQLHFVSGRVKAVEAIEPPAEVAERLEMNRYYLCRMRTDKDQPVVVFTEKVPRAWLAGGPDDARATVHGVFLKFAADGQQPSVPVLAAPRIAWYPDTPLGNLGMDVGLLDEADNRRPITGRDREAFYQLMAAAARSKPGELLRAADARLEESGEKSYSVYPLFREDQSQKGRLVALTGMAREVVRIPVDDPDIVARFGIDHYYQIALFTDDSQGNPIYFCVRELPQGMPTGAGPRFGEDVRVAGFFLKTWVYRTVADPAAPYEEKPGRGQVAPLLIGRDLVWYRQPERSSSVIAGAIAGGLFVVALLGVWVAIWRFNRGDRQFQRQTLTKTLGIDRPVRLDDLAADQPGSEPGQPADRDADRDRGDGFSF